VVLLVSLALVFVLGDSLSASALGLSSNWPRQISTHGARWLARFFAGNFGWRNVANKANGRGCLGRLNKLGMGFIK
jgi:hypothetical protein